MLQFATILTLNHKEIRRIKEEKLRKNIKSETFYK